jgi:hypothetical protein
LSPLTKGSTRQAAAGKKINTDNMGQELYVIGTPIASNGYPDEGYPKNQTTANTISPRSTAAAR